MSEAPRGPSSLLFNLILRYVEMADKIAGRSAAHIKEVAHSLVDESRLISRVDHLGVQRQVNLSVIRSGLDRNPIQAKIGRMHPRDEPQVREALKSLYLSSETVTKILGNLDADPQVGAQAARYLLHGNMKGCDGYATLVQKMASSQDHLKAMVMQLGIGHELSKIGDGKYLSNMVFEVFRKPPDFFDIDVAIKASAGNLYSFAYQAKICNIDNFKKAIGKTADGLRRAPATHRIGVIDIRSIDDRREILDILTLGTHFANRDDLKFLVRFPNGEALAFPSNAVLLPS